VDSTVLTTSLTALWSRQRCPRYKQRDERGSAWSLLYAGICTGLQNVVVPCASAQVSLKLRTSDSFNCRHRALRVLLDTVRFNQCRLYHALGVTTRSAHLTQLGGRASQTVSPGSPVR